MLDTPQELHFSDKSDLALRYYAAQARSHQYGSHPKLSHSAHAENDSQGRLLNIPTESLAHITSYLDAKSLFSLGLTNKTLHEHVADDNTWRAAFLLQFLGKRPESTASEGSAPLLRRTEVTWKREFVFRQNLLRCVLGPHKYDFALLILPLQSLGAFSVWYNLTRTPPFDDNRSSTPDG